jgi:hypothetical protein
MTAQRQQRAGGTTMDIIVEPTTVIRTRKDGTIVVDVSGQSKTTKMWGVWMDTKYIGAFRTQSEARREAARLSKVQR